MKINKSLIFPFLLILLCFSLFSCQTTTLLLKEKYTDPQVLQEEQLCPSQIQWQEVRPGVQLTQYVVNATKAQWKCIKIDLNTPGLEIAAETKPENLGKRFYLRQFAKKYDTVAAINTVPFDLDGGTFIPVSIVKIDGLEVCPLNPVYSALGLKKTTLENGDFVYRASIMNSQNQDLIDDCDFAFGGFFTILEGDSIYEFEKFKRSRSAAGISGEGRYLYLFAACGINSPTGRNGLNFEECAIILKALGCTKAMEFDGGHSTGLTLYNKDAVHPSLQRKVPAAFGIKFAE